jgi:hypothetical protein
LLHPLSSYVFLSRLGSCSSPSSGLRPPTCISHSLSHPSVLRHAETYPGLVLFCFLEWGGRAVLGFELRVLHLLGGYSTT